MGGASRGGGRRSLFLQVNIPPPFIFPRGIAKMHLINVEMVITGPL